MQPKGGAKIYRQLMFSLATTFHFVNCPPFVMQNVPRSLAKRLFNRPIPFSKQLSCLVLLLFPVATATTAQKSSGPPAASLKTFLERQGYGGTPLQRRLGNHLYVTTQINGNRTALVVDTGCPFTLLDRSSARKMRLGVEETKSTIMGVHGDTQRFGISKLASLGMGNCTFQNVPVQVADESELNEYARPHLDGLFGAHEMAKFGMIIDCTRQMMYVNPKGPSAATSIKLGQFLGSRGFARIPMRFNPDHHLEIEAAINGHPVRLTVDTGASTTLVSTPAASKSGTALMPLYSDGGEGIGHVQELSLGNGIIVHNAEVVVENVAKMVGAGLLGEEYLSWNFGIIDLGGMNLYLRPPDSAPSKKR
jgi:predicted aspartyl protease